jgi:hypothetical protein
MNPHRSSRLSATLRGYIISPETSGQAKEQFGVPLTKLAEKSMIFQYLHREIIMYKRFPNSRGKRGHIAISIDLPSVIDHTSLSNMGDTLFFLNYDPLSIRDVV